jgi:hypothetical protein
MSLVKLTPPALDRYTRLKKIIRDGRQTFIQVGLAIAEVKERKLYTQEYETFEEFCEKEYGWTARHCHGLAGAALAVKSLPPALGTTVPSVNAAKALAKVPPPKRTEVVKGIVASGKPVTERTIKAASPPPKAPKAKPQRPVDASGLYIPENLLPLWERRQVVQSRMSLASELRVILRKDEADGDPIFAQMSFNSALAHLDQLYADLASTKPNYVCPVCGGNEVVAESCTLCHGVGLLSDFYWKAVSSDLKNLRAKAVENQK